MAAENKASIAALADIQDSDGDVKSPLGADEARLAQMGENPGPNRLFWAFF